MINYFTFISVFPRLPVFETTKIKYDPDILFSVHFKNDYYERLNIDEHKLCKTYLTWSKLHNVCIITKILRFTTFVDDYKLSYFFTNRDKRLPKRQVKRRKLLRAKFKVALKLRICNCFFTFFYLKFSLKVLSWKYITYMPGNITLFCC